MKKAFTLIEVVVAIAILGISVLAFFSLYAYSAQQGRIARQTTEAANLAQGIIDQQTIKSYDELSIGTGTKIRISNDQADHRYNFYQQINISFVDSNLAVVGNDTGLKKIDVFIYWQEGTAEKNVQVSTLKSKR